MSKKKGFLKETNLTYDDYASMDDQNRYELVNGQLELMSPAPTTIHQMILIALNEQFLINCKSDYFILFAPIDVILSKNEVRQPDITLINRERVDILTMRGIEGAPDLVVEILSPSSLKRDKIDKLLTYAQYKIPEYWIVDPTSGILEQFVIVGDRYELINVFQGEETVTSPNITCVAFTMKTILDEIPNLQN